MPRPKVQDPYRLYSLRMRPGPYETVKAWGDRQSPPLSAQEALRAIFSRGWACERGACPAAEELSVLREHVAFLESLCRGCGLPATDCRCPDPDSAPRRRYEQGEPKDFGDEVPF